MTEIAECLDVAAVPFNKVNTMADVASDPHFVAREARIDLPDPDFGSLTSPCVVPRVRGRAVSPPATGPSVGQHNAFVYAEFGIAPEELECLRAQGVVQRREPSSGHVVPSASRPGVAPVTTPLPHDFIGLAQAKNDAFHDRPHELCRARLSITRNQRGGTSASRIMPA